MRRYLYIMGKQSDRTSSGISKLLELTLTSKKMKFQAYKLDQARTTD